MVVLSSFEPPESVVKHEQGDTRALLDKRDLGLGTLYVAESALFWRGPIGFSVDYPQISLHALSTDPNIYPERCMYIMLDSRVTLPGQPQTEESEDSEDEMDDVFSELIFAPVDKDSLQPIYEAVKDCQALHPDPDDMSTDEDEMFGDAVDYDEYDIGGGGEPGECEIQQMQRLVINEHHNGTGDHQLDDVNEEMFEDAD